MLFFSSQIDYFLSNRDFFIAEIHIKYLAQGYIRTTPGVLLKYRAGVPTHHATE